MRNWDDMRVFLATARNESLTGAGRDLRLDPATVGRRIGRLEESLGVTLFIRSQQGYALTEAGQKLLGHAEQAEQALRAGLGQATGAGEGLSGTIRIGAPDGCANYLLPQICARIAAQHPGLDIQILALPRVVNLSRREADLAIAVSRPETDRLRAEKLSDYRLSLAASSDWIARHGAPRSAADLGSARMIGYIPDMIFDAELDYLSALGVTRVPVASNSISVQLNLARSGAGMAVVHDFALPFAPELVRLLPNEIVLRRTFWLVTHAGPRDARLDRLAGMLRDGMRAELLRLEGSVV